MDAVFITVEGNVTSGFSFVGPFDTAEAAADHGAMGDQDWWVAQLIPPILDPDDEPWTGGPEPAGDSGCID